MIPDHYIDKAKHAIHRATGQHLGRTWEETPQWYRVGVTEEARAALEAVAADIWDDGYVAGVESAHEFFAGNTNADTPNPYRASETA